MLGSVGKLFGSNRRRGFAKTLRLATRWCARSLFGDAHTRLFERVTHAMEARFDRRFGTDTSSRLAKDAPRQTLARGNPYEATTRRGLRLIVRLSAC